MKQFLIVIILILGLTGCSSKPINEENVEVDLDIEKTKLKEEIIALEYENEDLRKQLMDIKQEIENLENENINLNNSINSYQIDFELMQEFMAFYQNNVTEDEFRNLLKHNWSYSIRLYTGTLDDYEPLASPYDLNDTVLINSSNFELVISERQFINRCLSDYYELIASINLEKYADHIKLVNYDNYEEHFGSGTIVDSKMFYVKDVPSGTMLNFEVTEELADWLKLDTTTIKVYVEY